ncbi:MAG: protein kinase [Acidobacteria bacterium]|nr:protein kinase [Acidobacteriota bacterium]
MTPELWRKVEPVVAEALNLPHAERAAYVACVCDGEPEIRAEVDLLLAEAERDSPLKTLEWVATAGGEEALAGKRAGPYRLVERIGEGGMGVVYRAERDDDAYRKQVAIKLIAGAASSGEMLRRFRSERQILAALEHPNIARLLDGGVSGDGLHYIVMELVEGVPITDYCERRDLSVRERMRLFRTVCSAVHFAHQRLVVHRDLKPGNVLVGEDGAPKLLDFGIAKILAGPPETAAPLTILHPMTPGYASPEQLRGAAVTTASDVYSLGVLCYELLARRQPYRLAGKTYEEALHIVSDTEPEKPSAAAGAAVSPDLDAIVQKAMSKEPGERYASVEAMAQDMDRYLDGRPVAARPRSFGYVARKFVARHRLSVSASAVAVLLVLAGLGTALWQARIARIEHEVAQRRFNDVRKLANSVMYELHDGIASLAGSTEVRRLLVTRALGYLDPLAKEADGDLDLRMDLAAGYGRIGDVQGNPGLPNLGDKEGALASYAKARAALEAVVARDPVRFDARYSLAQIHLRINHVCTNLRRQSEALEHAQKAIEIFEALVRGAPDKPAARGGLAAAYFRMADTLDIQDPPRSVKNRAKALEIFQTLLEKDRENAEAQRNVALAHKTLGNFFLNNGEIAQALPHVRQALTLDEKRVARQPNHPMSRLDLTFDLSLLGDILWGQGDLEGALEGFRRAAAIRRDLVAADPKDVRAKQRLAFAQMRIGGILQQARRPREAVRSLQESLAIWEALAAASPGDTDNRASIAEANTYLGRAEEALNQYTAACGAFGRAHRIYRDFERQGISGGWEREEAARIARKAAACAQRAGGKR